jgi:DNA-binding SARP family transcriptional activator
MLELLRSSSGVPFFICAPRGTGRTSLALEYTQRQHDLENVLWIDAGTDGFREAANAGTLLEHLERQRVSVPDHFSLVVLDDLPSLEDRAASRLSDWIDRLVEEGVEVIVITTPYEDCLENYQSDRLVIEGARLVASQKWSRKRMVATLSQLLEAPAPRQPLTFAALMILAGRGIVDNLRELGYLIPSASYAMLKRCCPFIRLDEDTGYFDATGLPVMELRQPLLALLNEALRSGDEAEASETERSFERLTQLAIRLFERSERERSQMLLELAGGLLTHDDAGFPLAGVGLGGGPAPVSGASAPAPTVPPGALAPAAAGVVAAAHTTPVPATPFASFPVTAIVSEPFQDVRPPADRQPAQLMVRLFGDFELLRGGARVEGQHLRRTKVRELMVHLVLNRGCGIARDALMEKLWPGKDFLLARDNFHATWSRLNRLLIGGTDASLYGSNPYLSNNRGLCRLDPAYVNADVWEFEQLSRAFLFEQGGVEQRIEAVYRLEQLYRADILSGCKLDPLIQAAQRRYRSILVDVMLEASRLFSREGNATNAVWFARRAYDTDPSREDVYRILMDMQDKAGQRTSALRTYFDCKRFLSEELGILPSQKTTALYQELILDQR